MLAPVAVATLNSIKLGQLRCLYPVHGWPHCIYTTLQLSGRITSWVVGRRVFLQPQQPLVCVGAWEEVGNTCEVESVQHCDTRTISHGRALL